VKFLKLSVERVARSHMPPMQHRLHTSRLTSGSPAAARGAQKGEPVVVRLVEAWGFGRRLLAFFG
jgi:hypothetical protein